MLQLSETTSLFVYGSLLKEEENHFLIATGLFLGSDVLDGYSLINLGRYPMIIKDTSSSVWGEVYQIPQPWIQRLDEFEEHPQVYQRRWLALRSGGSAWVYLGQDQFTKGYPAIPSGRWQDR